MANTLKFGNGEWYGKKDTILAYNDENSNYKPLPFDFSRASSATVVNKDGLIETVGSDMPRIDYKDDSEGALLLEPQRTNLILYSQEFSNASWVKSNGGVGSNPIVTPNYTSSPLKGYMADRVIFNLNGGSTSSDLSTLQSNSFNLTAGQNMTYYMAVKTNDGSTVNMTLNANLGSTEIKSITPEWTIIKTSTTSIATSSGVLRLRLRGSELVSNYADISVAYAQLEVGSYSTSYIPTQGSAVTRLKDTCTQTPPTGVLGQTEGTLFFDVNISHIVGNEALGGINSGGYANHVTIQRIGNTIQFVRNSATQSGATIVTSSAITVGRYRLALAYKSGDIACFLNGTQVSTTQTQTFTNGTINLVRISGDAIGALPFADTYNKSQLYNTRLSNSELATLTQV